MADPFANTASRLFDAFVGTEPNATYYPEGGDPIDCRFYQTGRNRSQTHYSDLSIAALTGELLESEVGSDLRAGERVDYDGTSYVISEDPRSDGYIWTVSLDTRTAAP